MDRLIPDAFHGTSKKRASAINSEGFKPSVGKDLYLGDGVYFFESSQSYAEHWAIDHYGPEEAAVFQCKVRLGRCIDLTDAKTIDFVARFAELVRNQAMSRRSLKQKIGITDALLINLICQRAEFDSVRAASVSSDKGKIFSGSRFYFQSRLIVCVRNINNIVRTERIV